MAWLPSGVAPPGLPVRNPFEPCQLVAESGFVEARLRGQRCVGRRTQQRGVQVRAVASQQAKRPPIAPVRAGRPGPAAGGRPRGHSCCADPPSIDRTGPAARVASASARSPYEPSGRWKRKKRATPQRCSSAASRAAYQARSRSRRCTEGRSLRQRDVIGQRPVGAGADPHGRGVLGRFHRLKAWTREAPCASLRARCQGEFKSCWNRRS